MTAPTKSKLTPWVRGPFEMLEHAEGHFCGNSDADRRLALVSFDNAIEVAITTFLQLNPRLRGAKSYAREDVQKWLQNYHTKIEFFETYVTEGRIPLQATIAEILWYHTLRNEIYHSGNGMTPERHCLDGIRSAAIEVFDILYSINSCSLLSASISVAETTPEKSSTYIPAQSRFLQTYVAFERALSSSLLVLGAKKGNGITPVGELWSLLGSQMHVSDIHTRVVTEAAMVRGELVHSGYTKLADYELEELAGCTTNL